MSGAAFSAKGTSTGQAPTTSYFGTIPDKYNMLQPTYYFNTGSSNGIVVQSQTFNCNRIDTWIPWDNSWGAGTAGATCSLGATTMAPDGTNTGFHITEATNNTYHVMTAGTDDYQLRVPVRYRFAAFLKAGERTRAWMFVGEAVKLIAVNNFFEGGIYCVFDLAGGQIAVQPFLNNNGSTWPYNYAPIGAGMIPFGNGWYLCYMDVTNATNGFRNPVPAGTGVQTFLIGPDKGSGTAAINNSYTGDGTSGIYAWRTNAMPAAAYDVHTVSFFNDFVSLSEVDVNNTLAPGFKWYVAGATWPGITNFGWSTPVQPFGLSVISYGGSNTVFKVLNNTAYQGMGGTAAPNPATAAYSGTPGQYVGFGAKPPFVAEWVGAFDYGLNINPSNTDELAWWMLPIEYIINPANLNATSGHPLAVYEEYDTMDSGSPGSEQYPIAADLNTVNSGGLQRDDNLSPATGITVWSPQFFYAIGRTVSWMGHAYSSLVANNHNNQPDISPTQWSNADASITNPTITNRFADDFTLLNTWTFMRLPDHSAHFPYDNVGMFMHFYNGVYCVNQGGGSGSFGYGAAMNGSGVVTGGALQTNGNSNAQSQLGDANHWMFIVGPGRFRNIYTDSVKIYQ